MQCGAFVIFYYLKNSYTDYFWHFCYTVRRLRQSSSFPGSSSRFSLILWIIKIHMQYHVLVYESAPPEHKRLINSVLPYGSEPLYLSKASSSDLGKLQQIGNALNQNSIFKFLISYRKPPKQPHRRTIRNTWEWRRESFCLTPRLLITSGTQLYSTSSCI